MDLDIKKLIDLHRIDNQILEIHEGKGDLPNLISERENKVKDLEDILKNSEDKMKNIDKNINSFNSQASDFNSKIENYNSQIYSVKNNKEYEALIKEIDFLKSESSDVANQLDEINKEKEELSDIINDSKSRIEEISSKLDSDYQELKEISAETENEESKLVKNKTKLLKEIKNKNFIKAYEEGNQHFQLSSVSRESCSNCFSTLPPQFILNVKKMDKLYTCPSCGINLYWEE